MKKQKILIIEPEKDIADSLAEVLGSEGYQTHIETDLNLLFSGQSFKNFDLIVVDTDSDDTLNSKIADLRKSKQIDTRLFVISCYCTKYRTQGFICKGIDGMITKPMELDELVDGIRSTLK